MWATILLVVVASAIALPLWAVINLLACGLSVYTRAMQRQSLEVVTDAIRAKLPDVTTQAMDAAVRRHELRALFGRTPATPWPLSDGEWQRVLEILHELRAADASDDAAVDEHVVAALLGVAPGCAQVAELLRERGERREGRNLRLHVWIASCGDDLRALIHRSRGWLLRENMRLRGAAIKHVMLPTLARIRRDAIDVGQQYQVIGGATVAVLWLFGSREPADLFAYAGLWMLVGALVAVAVAVERAHREVLTACLAPDPTLPRMGKVLAMAGFALVFVVWVVGERAGLADANTWAIVAFGAVESVALAVLGGGAIHERMTATETERGKVHEVSARR